MAIPVVNIQFELYKFASSFGLDAIPAQKTTAIAYESRIVNSAERNYAISEQECLGVIWALEKCRPLFYKLLLCGTIGRWIILG